MNALLFPPILCVWTCKRCGTVSMGEAWDGFLFQCPGPGCGIYFTARVAPLAGEGGPPAEEDG